MQVIFGQLVIDDLDSTLVPQNAWLLLSGFPDPEQAARAATNYIVNVKHIKSGTNVAVTGTPTNIGDQPAIIMSDINPSGGLEQHAPEAMMKTGRERAARSAGGPKGRSRKKS
jgi:hypothetical protein